MKHQIKAVLFDLDGVIVFTDKYHYLGWKKLAEEEGWDFDEELNNQLRGIPRMASLQVILDHNDVELSEEQKKACAERKNGYYQEMLRTELNEDDLYPGALELIEKLRAEGVRLGLCSSSRNALTVLERLGLTGRFRAIVTGNEISRAKPAPQIFLLAADGLGVPPFHCLVFEDAESGVEAALAAGMKCIGVGTPEVLPNAPECVQDYEEVDVGALLDAGRTSRPPAEAWTLAETEPRPNRRGYWESVFALSNGYIGLRGSYEEEAGAPAGPAYPATFINGIYGYEPYEFVVRFPGYPPHRHAVLNLCDWRALNIEVDGERFSMSRGEVTEYRRELDMRRGVLERSLVWQSPAGAKLRIRTTRLVSMRRRHNAALRCEVTPLDSDVRLAFVSEFRGKVPGRALPGEHTELVEHGQDREVQHFLYRTKTAPFRIGMAFLHELSGEHASTAVFTPEEGDHLVERFEVDAPAGQSVTLEKHACFYTNLEASEGKLVSEAVEGARAAAEDGFEALLAEQTDWWARHWQEADVEIGGNVSDQQALRFSLFHLRQSHPEDDLRSISANGLTGDAYSGHVFWDTEMYISPYFLYTRPGAVRPLLMYRWGLLDRARERAEQMDGAGALYSWNSISGEECGVVHEASTAEYHLVSDIALAVARYTQQTGDEAFLYDHGAEILFETARFLADLGAFIALRDDRFCINVVCGPDEYACGVNNNCYTNMLAAWHFRYAADVWRRMEERRPEEFAELSAQLALGPEERELWLRAAESMYVPWNEELGIHEQDDSFLRLEPVDMSKVPRNTDIRWSTHPLNLWRMRVIKQADVVLLMFVLGWEFDREVKRANYEFYEPLTCHGSSLSAGIHSIIASEIGRPEDAYDYFRQSVRLDLDDFKRNTAGGLHLACAGGNWMAVVNGFAGMRDWPDGLHFDPCLPEAWDSYSFDIVYRGSRIGVKVAPEQVEYRLLSGPAVEFTSSGEEVTLSPSEPEAAVPVRGETDTI